MNLDTQHSAVVFKLAKPGKQVLAGMTPNDAHLMHMILGITGEVGELVDAIKKSIIYGKDMDRENIIEEFGDLEFYLEGLRQGLGIKRSTTLEQNIHKLSTGPKARYKNGYSDQAAQARSDKE